MKSLIAFCLLALLVVTTPALAKEDTRFQQLVDDINKQIVHAEKQRLADPWFLRELRQIIAKYDFPWRKKILFNDFSGAKGPQAPKPWRVEAGEFLVDWRSGLRSVVERGKPAAPAANPRQGQRDAGAKQDLGTMLLGALLEQTLGGGKAQQRAPAPAKKAPPAAAKVAAIVAPVAISNAFSVELIMSSRTIPGDGLFAFGPYQKGGDSPGYRLVYRPNVGPGQVSLELVRHGSRGAKSVLELYTEPLKLEDGKHHTLLWTRDPGGSMQVSVDGRAVIQVVDRSFRDPFSGFVLFNGGGDYSVRQIKIDGM